jgi:hypothetical protein
MERILSNPRLGQFTDVDVAHRFTAFVGDMTPMFPAPFCNDENTIFVLSHKPRSTSR